jgi:hypothetical protein
MTISNKAFMYKAVPKGWPGGILSFETTHCSDYLQSQDKIWP